MKQWSHGYYVDSAYTFGHYPETMPVRLYWASLINEHIAPTRQFRYLDAGCGQGFNLIMAAAAHPDSEFIGLDFLPEHIAHATLLASRCGLTNIRFIEADFVDLARDPGALGLFDYAVCHGVSTWVAPEVKQGLYRLIGQVLKPGGVFYNSYNTLPGWLATQPYQNLVLLHQRHQRNHALQAAGASLAQLAQLQKDHVPLFAAQPGLEERLAKLEGLNVDYLQQEYCNEDWQPVFVSQMLDAMAEVKLSYLTSATLPEALDVGLSPELRTWLANQPTEALKLQLQDYALNQAFRRDLYVKGRRRPWPQEAAERIGSMRFALNPLKPRPPADQAYRIAAGNMAIDMHPDRHAAVIRQLLAAPAGLALADFLADPNDRADLRSHVESLSMLMHGGWVIPQVPDAETAPVTAADCNRAIASAVSQGAGYNCIALPRAGGAGRINGESMLLLDSHYTAGTASVTERASRILNTLDRLGNTLTDSGQAVTDPATRLRMIETAITAFTTDTLPFLTAMGAA
jgi:SAM-dependent methyltransferase